MFPIIKSYPTAEERNKTKRDVNAAMIDGVRNENVNKKQKYVKVDSESEDEDEDESEDEDEDESEDEEEDEEEEDKDEELDSLSKIHVRSLYRFPVTFLIT